MDRIKELYKDYHEIPYISSDRNIGQFMQEVSLSKSKLVPKRHMERLDNGLLPGDIILLWRVAFGTYTTETVVSKYFEYTYGIDGKANIKKLVKDGYVGIQNAFEAMEHLSTAILKSFLKMKNVPGLSKLTKDSAMLAVKEHFTLEELASLFTIRGYVLTELGEQALQEGQFVVDKHPKKKY